MNVWTCSVYRLLLLLRVDKGWTLFFVDRRKNIHENWASLVEVLSLQAVKKHLRFWDTHYIEYWFLQAHFYVVGYWVFSFNIYFNIPYIGWKSNIIIGISTYVVKRQVWRIHAMLVCVHFIVCDVTFFKEIFTSPLLL